MLNAELKQKLAKIYELVKRGTDGEQAAAQRMLDKLLEKHDLTGIDLDSLNKDFYFFKYSTALELMLMRQILICLIDDSEALDSVRRQTIGVKQLKIKLCYLDYLKVECAYEYFRRHMKEQWNKLCAVELAKKRKTTTKNKRRNELQRPFMNSYAIKSGLYRPEDLSKINVKSEKQYRDLMNMEQVEGGQFNTQMHTGLLLGDGTN